MVGQGVRGLAMTTRDEVLERAKALVEQKKQQHGVVEEGVCQHCGGPEFWVLPDDRRLSCPCTWTRRSTWTRTKFGGGE